MAGDLRRLTESTQNHEALDPVMCRFLAQCLRDPEIVERAEEIFAPTATAEVIRAVVSNAAIFWGERDGSVVRPSSEPRARSETVEPGDLGPGISVRGIETDSSAADTMRLCDAIAEVERTGYFGQVPIPSLELRGPPEGAEGLGVSVRPIQKDTSQFGPTMRIVRPHQQSAFPGRDSFQTRKTLHPSEKCMGLPGINPQGATIAGYRMTLRAASGVRRTQA